MKNHAQRAQGLFDGGYNCAQSVLGAFCEELGLDFETAMKQGRTLSCNSLVHSRFLYTG